MPFLDETTSRNRAFPLAGGAVGQQIRMRDWRSSPIGPPASWPHSLRVAVNMILGSKQPMFIAWGPELVFIYNDAYAPILAQRHPDALGRAFPEIWSDIWDDIRPLVDRALAGEATWSENLHLVMERDGAPQDTWYTFSYSPIRDEEDEIAGMFCACIETTAQVLAERRSTAERERLFEMTRDLFGVAGFDGYLKSINPAWARLLGRSQEALLATPFAEIIHPEDLAITTEVIARLERGEPVHQFHVRLLKTDGQAVPLAWSAVPDGTPGSGVFYTVGRDISDDVRREEALRQSHKMEAIGQLTGGIAHDFNNLLQAIYGNLDLIRCRPDDAARVERLAANGLVAAERGGKLTAQLLAFSQAQKLDLRPVAVSPLIRGMADMIQRSIGPEIRVAIDCEDDRLGALIDPTQLDMALLNLAINARDAMPDGGELAIAARKSTVAAGPGLAGGDYVEIRVSDTGTGMSSAVAARAFDPFFTTKGIGEGAGLGLSQVYGMTTQAGGAARIEARPSRGTTVVLLLKAVDVPAEPAAAERAPVRIPHAAGKTILVVDDDAAVRAFLADSLEDLGFKVITAEDGAGGLAALLTSDPDILLLDFAMPGMNGAEVADRARARRPDLPIVFASGYAESAAIEAAVGPAAVVLKKPFRMADLETVLGTVLAG